MKKSMRLLASVAAIALMPMGAMTMPTASSAPCDDGQWFSPHSNACQPLPCPYGASFDANDDVCQCVAGWRYNPLRNICQSVYIYAPPLLHH
jgi:hypothetical protein